MLLLPRLPCLRCPRLSPLAAGRLVLRRRSLRARRGRTSSSPPRPPGPGATRWLSTSWSSPRRGGGSGRSLSPPPRPEEAPRRGRSARTPPPPPSSRWRARDLRSRPPPPPPRPRPRLRAPPSAPRPCGPSSELSAATCAAFSGWGTSRRRWRASTAGLGPRPSLQGRRRRRRLRRRQPLVLREGGLLSPPLLLPPTASPTPLPAAWPRSALPRRGAWGGGTRWTSTWRRREGEEPEAEAAEVEAGEAAGKATRSLQPLPSSTRLLLLAPALLLLPLLPPLRPL